MRIYEGRQDASEQREQIQQAISLGVSAIIVNHGLPESLKDVAWVATAATNPAVVGAVSVRAAALLVAGQDPGHHIVVKPTLITRDDLVKNDIKTIADLGAKFPAFRSSDAATAAWIPAAQ